MRLYRYLYWLLFHDIARHLEWQWPVHTCLRDYLFSSFPWRNRRRNNIKWQWVDSLSFHVISSSVPSWCSDWWARSTEGISTIYVSKAQIINMFTIIWGTGIDHWMHGWQGCGKHQEDNGSRNEISARSQKAFVLRVATSGVHHYASPKTCQLTQEGDPLERWGAVSGCFWQGSTRPSKLKGLKDKNTRKQHKHCTHILQVVNFDHYHIVVQDRAGKESNPLSCHPNNILLSASEPSSVHIPDIFVQSWFIFRKLPFW